MSYPPDPYQQQPYGQQPYQPYQPPAATGTNTMAILSLIFAFVFWPLGIVFGHIGRGQIRRSGESGAGLATAGLVISYIFGVLTIIGCGLWIALVAFVSTHPDVIPTPTS
jgi:Domain of unknown function (DUF4190)